MVDRKKKYYCDFVKCRKLGTCIIPMSGEDCYTLGMLEEYKVKKYEEWLKEQ